MDHSGTDVQSKLEAARKELLDLGLRNSLLNYRLPRSRGLEVIEATPQQIFQTLVGSKNKKPMTFRPMPAKEADGSISHTSPVAAGLPPGGDLSTHHGAAADPSSIGDTPPGRSPAATGCAGGIEPSVASATEIPADDPDTASSVGPATDTAPVASPSRQSDLQLPTALPAEQLQARLLATYYAARTFIEEQGVNILFLALGMLHWYEEDNRQAILRAPLLLVPVTLERSNARERFQILYTGDDIEDNLSLVEKLKTAFGIAFPRLPDVEDLDVDAYFDLAARAIESQPRWSIDRAAVALGFFSFGKFLMYRDLDEEGWPEEARPTEHPLLRAMLAESFVAAAPQTHEDSDLDTHSAPAEHHQVVDADSSQMLALLDVRNGRNLVIQGPPGTGKSQTITNLIAEALGSGKTVLFVAEKMAALEVVKRRLDQIGLGDGCLELHSQKRQKKAVLDELRRTLDLGAPRPMSGESDLGLLTDVRDRLNGYCEAVNTPVGASGVAPYEAFGRLLQLRQVHEDTRLPRLDITGIADWTGAEYQRRLMSVEDLQCRLTPVGVPREHPFWGSRRTLLLPLEIESLREAARDAGRTTAALRESATTLAAALELPEPVSRVEAERLCRAAERALEAPDLAGLWLDAVEWRSRREDLDAVLAAGCRLAELHGRYDTCLLPEAWDQELLEVRQHLVVYGHKWWRFLSGAYRQARNRLGGLCRGVPPRETDAQIELVDAVMEARRQQRIVRPYETLLSDLLGPRWHGELTDWSALAPVLEWLLQLHREIDDGVLPDGFLRFLESQASIEDLKAPMAQTRSALAAHTESVGKMVELLELDESRRFGPGAALADQDLAVQEATFADWADRIHDLQALVAFNHLGETLLRDGLGTVVGAAEVWPEAQGCLTAAFQHTWFEALVERAYRERPALAGFDAHGQQYAILKFCELDTLTFDSNRTRLATAHWQAVPRHEAGGQLGVLRQEFAKRARHLPLRQLMLKAGNAIQAIKPVFMMSPISIANFLPPGALKFDLVVFDEASQVKPVDAFGAILRGSQVVVVGDDQQLPPTSFFDKLLRGDGADDTNPTADVESILTLCAARFGPGRMLRWHYRSRHESLISVSNSQFYDNRLVIFPSPDVGREQVGLGYHHLPETCYEGGKSGTQTNPGEALAVARAVLEHARVRPHLTLGVAAFSMAQVEAIQAQLELLRRQEPSCEEFFAAHPHEPFFIKNLENVQGDERDVIFISIGYGRAADGSVSLNFGPLNSSGGERRLNVLITRARSRCEVFTNLTAHDLKRSNARGVQALHAYLAHAQGEEINLSGGNGRQEEAPLEATVASALRERGHRVERQVGSAGFYLDLAVVDLRRAGGYLLGIALDGPNYALDAPNYQRWRSARDRDRLCPQMLQALGWRIHRIWSPDWFRNPDGELQRLVQAIEEAQTRASAGKAVARPASVPRHAPIERDDNRTPPPEAPTLAAYALATLPVPINQPLHTVSTATLAAWVTDVVRVESPVHVNEVARRIADAAGCSRIGTRIQGLLDGAYRQALGQGQICRQGSFLWLAERQQPVPRDRSRLPASCRKLELVAPEELAAAVERVVASAYGMASDQIPSAVCRLLGFSRVSEEMRALVASIVDGMVANKRLASQGGHLVVREG